MSSNTGLTASGLSSAIDEMELEAEIIEPGEAWQTDLFDNSGQNLAQTGLTEKRKPGRPAGSRNNSTLKWKDFIEGRYGSPLERLGMVYSQPTNELADELGCDREVALKIQTVCASKVADFFYAKPTPEKGGNNSAGQLIINRRPDSPENAGDKTKKPKMILRPPKK